MHRYLWNTLTLYSKVNVTNADNSGGHVIGQLYRYRKSGKTFVIISQEDKPGYGVYTPWYEVLADGIVKGIKQRDFELALKLGKIELVE